MTYQVDLNQVRDHTIRNRESNINLPSSPSRSIYVDSEGYIVTQAQVGEQRQLFQAPQKVFAIQQK